jgi:hypothetical protein
MIAVSGVGVAAAPEKHRVLTIVVELVVAACLGSLFAYFLRLRCRMQVPWPYRSLRWSIRQERHQLALREIAQVTTLLDDTSDEPAHHVVFELRSGKYVRLSDYSWRVHHAAKLARRVNEFLEAVKAVAHEIRPPATQ